MKKSAIVGGLALLAVAAGLGWAGATGKLAVLGVGNAAAAKSPDAAASAPPLEFRPTEVVRPVLARVPRTVRISGPLVAPDTAVVRAKTAGTLVRLDVAEGQRLQAGQVLGRIDMIEQNARIAERQANLQSARASLIQAQRTHASNERLAAQSFISPIALDNSRAQLDTAKAAVAAAQAALDASQVGLRDATPLAPIAGIVAKRHVVAGEKVSMEQTLVTIVNLRTLELAGTVGTHEVGALSAGMAAQIEVEGVAEPVAGKIARIAPAADAGTRAIGVTLALANPEERLRAGQYALAMVKLADDQQRLVLPATAIVSQSGQSHVWTIENGLLVRRSVTTGREDAATGRVEVLSGVDASAQVLTARFDNLREGAKALINQQALARQASAASASALR